MALTFDDGPYSEFTPQIINTIYKIIKEIIFIKYKIPQILIFRVFINVGVP
ncbi:hypothetical protein [Alkaliphilus sp. B6464]|uniref:hypothetical protein n=1 Tax=Alkaliphilus sp. B6464 TaxID=2731219 RepID=UPI003FA4B9F1